MHASTTRAHKHAHTEFIPLTPPEWSCMRSCKAAQLRLACVALRGYKRPSQASEVHAISTHIVCTVTPPEWSCMRSCKAAQLRLACAALRVYKRPSQASKVHARSTHIIYTLDSARLVMHAFMQSNAVAACMCCSAWL